MQLKNGIRLKRRGAENIAQHSRSQNFLDCGGNPECFRGTPLWKVCPQSKSGVAAALQSSLRFASASCHRSPKSSDGNFFVETITPIEHNHCHCTGYENGIPVESTKPDVGAFASRSGRVVASIPPDSGSAGNRRRPSPGRRHPQGISA